MCLLFKKFFRKKGKDMFDTAVEIVLSHEGGYVNDTNDNGGETNYGISKRAYPKLDIKNLTRNEAKEIYRRDYWNKVRGDKLKIGVAIVLFDMAVNMGVKRSVRMMQEIAGVKRDGIFGEKTLAAVHALNSNYVIEELTKRRILYYASLNDFKHFGRGWTSRSIEVMSSALLIRDYL